MPLRWRTSTLASSCPSPGVPEQETRADGSGSPLPLPQITARLLLQGWTLIQSPKTGASLMEGKGT